MFNALASTAQFLLPSGAERVFISVGAGVGAVFSFLFGSAEPLIQSLLFIVAVDFLTGTVGALRTGTWTSHEFGLGIAKKIGYLAIIAVAHKFDFALQGMLQIEHPINYVENITICAYAAGEFGSILENMDRCGLAGAVPAPIRRLIKVLNERVDNEIDKIKEK